MLLENSGSIARDILATERTFLAWARTGLGFVGAGTALFAAYHRRQHEEPQRRQQQTPASHFYNNDIVPACALLTESRVEDESTEITLEDVLFGFCSSDS